MQLVGQTRLSLCDIKISAEETSAKNYELYCSIFNGEDFIATKRLLTKEIDTEIESILLENNLHITKNDFNLLSVMSSSINASLVRSTMNKIAVVKVSLRETRELSTEDIDSILGKIDVLSREDTSGEVLVSIGENGLFAEIEFYDNRITKQTITTIVRIVSKFDDSYVPGLIDYYGDESKKLYNIEYRYLAEPILDFIKPNTPAVVKGLGGLVRKKVREYLDRHTNNTVNSSEEKTEYTDTSVKIIPTKTRDNKYGIKIELENVKKPTNISKIIDKINKAGTETTTLQAIEGLLNGCEDFAIATITTLFTPDRYTVLDINGIKDCILFNSSNDRDRIINVIADSFYDNNTAESISKI